MDTGMERMPASQPAMEMTTAKAKAKATPTNMARE